MRSLGVLLAGGRGTRLGTGIPKALMVCGGRTLLARALGTLATQCAQVVVVAPHGMELPVPRAERVDDPPDAHGALAALRALRGNALAVMAAPRDLPQPLAAWYASGARAKLEAALAAGERSVIAACATLAPRLVRDNVLEMMSEGGGFQWNVNTFEDLARAERTLAGPPS